MCPERDEAEVAKSDGASATILLVEDEVLTRLAFAEFLRECGYMVFEAANAQEAEAILLSEPDVHIVFSDIHMPLAGDGVRLANWIETHLQALPVILTSGAPDSLAAAKQLCKNVAAFIDKPYSHDLALAHLRHALARRAMG